MRMLRLTAKLLEQMSTLRTALKLIATLAHARPGQGRGAPVGMLHCSWKKAEPF
jgi:hypothetical protein